MNGFGAGPSETLGPVVISDLIFLHDRGTYNALYFATYFGSLVVSSLSAGHRNVPLLTILDRCHRRWCNGESRGMA